MPKNPDASTPAETAAHAHPSPPPLATGERSRARWLLGPALVAGVAYLDPGNVASNMTAGAQFGYLLVWVVVLGNVIAWLVQYLSAKLGVVTGRSLAELLGDRIRRPGARRAYGAQAVLVAMATDVAEVIGGAVALWLLFDVPLLVGGALTGAASIVLLLVQSRRGARGFEAVVIALMVLVVAGFGYGVLLAPPDPVGVATGLVPRFEGAGSVLLAASILGATIMPHAIYAHSALARDRFRASGIGIPRLLRATRWDVTIALAIAGAVNLAMLLLAAAALAGVPGTDSLEGAYAALRDGVGATVATLFAVALLASGLASTAVGAYAGGEIIGGLLRLRLPVLVRRLVTLVPALAILGIGVDPTQALVLSQVVLSFGIPFALVPLVVLTAKATVLGAYRNRVGTTVAGGAASVFLIVLNGVLLWLVFTG